MGLYVILFCSLIGIIPFFLFRKLARNLIRYYINKVIRNDCLIYDNRKYSKENYFNRKPFIINFRSHNLYKLLSFTEKRVVINQNNNYSDFISNYKNIFFIN